jgi:hypothetical protein
MRILNTPRNSFVEKGSGHCGNWPSCHNTRARHGFAPVCEACTILYGTARDIAAVKSAALASLLIAHPARLKFQIK